MHIEERDKIKIEKRKNPTGNKGKKPKKKKILKCMANVFFKETRKIHNPLRT